MKQSASGQSLSEYGVIGALVAVVSIAGLMGASGDLNKLLGGLKGDIGSHQGQNKPAIQTPQVTNPPIPPAMPYAAPSTISTVPPGGATSATGSTPAGGSTLITLPNGQQFATSMPTSLSKSVQTAGANGTQELLAQTIEQIGQQMLAAGQIDQESYNAFVTIANAGHQAAAASKIIEDAAAQCSGDVACFNSTPVTFNGQTYSSVAQLRNQLGWPEDANGTPQSGPTDAAMQTALYTLSPGYGKISQDTYNTLDQLTHTISLIGNSVSWEAQKVETNPGQFPPSTLHDQLLQEMPGMVGTDVPITAQTTANGVMDQKSAQICTTGQGTTDSGTKCTQGG